MSDDARGNYPVMDIWDRRASGLWDREEEDDSRLDDEIDAMEERRREQNAD